jgi:hypothetical protein
MQDKSQRVSLAEATSSIGAGILGMGLGVSFADYLRGFGTIIILLGAVMHAWGMLDMKRMEKAAGQRRPPWSAFLYVICWTALGLLALWLAVSY